MLFVQVCVGSSCHLKGSQLIVELLQKAIRANGLENEITLVGTLCVGKCNRVGVSIKVNEEIYVGITTDNYQEFFNQNILSQFKED